ncbi:uncharacterized protein si:ch211-161h7.4 isoform X3 [Alosa sapidissima]|uniref:uncharacterized protein si:ch211-161h7.4 isoform X3 n=1 Tax=Alosa sapidissima TaxID=34773 RepID=UPI001C09A8F1|nr:uncharacterized protein si:ch211-161h7.4 isoform X3 [Alosa sapidissima]
MESKTSHLIKGRKKLRYFTDDERALPRIQDVFSVGDIDAFLDCTSKTKLDSGFPSPLLPEEEAPQEEECVALPTEEKNIGEAGLTECPFKDSAPLKTSSPIIVASSIHEDEVEAKLLASALLFPYDNEDPIEGNMDKPLSILTGDLAREASLHETLILTPPKRFTLGVKTQQGDRSPTLTPPTTRSHVNLEEKNLPGALENHTLTEMQMNEEQGSSVSPVVSTQTAVIKEPDSSLKAFSVADDRSFQKKLREFLMPRNIESARVPTPARAPSPQELDEDFFILEDDAPLLFSLKPKTPSQTSRPARQPSKKAEVQAETGSDAADGALFGTENEPGAGGKAAGAAPTSEPPAKASAVQKKRGKQSKQTALRAAPEEGGSFEGLCEVGGRTAKGVPAEASSKAPAALRKTGKQRERQIAAALATAAEPLTAVDAGADADADMASKRPERRPAKPISEAQSPAAAEDDHGDYGNSPSPSPLMEVPQQTVTKTASKRALNQEKPFLSKKRKLCRTSEMYAVSHSPELKSDTKTSKAASTGLENTAKSPSAAPAAVSLKSQKAQSKKKKEKESNVTQKKKRPTPVLSEEVKGDTDQALTQPHSPHRGDETDATGYSKPGRQDPSQDLSGCSTVGRRRRNRPGNWWAVNPETQDENDISPPKRPKNGKRKDGKMPKKTGRQQKKEAAASLEQVSADVIEKGTRTTAKSPRQQTDGKATLKSRQRKVKGEGRADQKRPQTGKGRRKRPQEEAMSAPPNQLEEEEEEAAAGLESDQAGSELQVNMLSDAPAEPVQSLHVSKTVSRADAPQPQGRMGGRQRGRLPGKWWESQQQPQPEPEADIVPSPSPPHPHPEPRARVPTPGMPAAELHLSRQRVTKLGSGSRKPRNQLAKKPLARHAGTPKTLKGSMASFGALYSAGKSHGRNAVVQKVRKNLLNSLEDSSNRSNDHTSMDASSQDRLNSDDGHQEVCVQVSNSVGLESVVRLKSGDVLPASDWPSQNLGVPGLKSGPSSMIQLQEEEEDEEDRNMSLTLLVPMALSEGDICGPLLRPLTLSPDDWKNLTYWLREVWRTNVKYNGQLITADHFHWYTHEGRALGHKFDLVCNSYANGKILLGSYMHKPAQVDQHTTTVFNVYTSSVRVQINDLKSDYIPGQAFVVPRGQSYSIRNLTPVPAILWYHRMFANITEDS